MTQHVAHRTSDEIHELRAEIERLQLHAKSMVDSLNADIDAKAAQIVRLRELLCEMVADEPDTPLGTYFADIEAALKHV